MNEQTSPAVELSCRQNNAQSIDHRHCLLRQNQSNTSNTHHISHHVISRIAQRQNTHTNKQRIQKSYQISAGALSVWSAQHNSWNFASRGLKLVKKADYYVFLLVFVFSSRIAKLLNPENLGAVPNQAVAQLTDGSHGILDTTSEAGLLSFR